jgi:DNA-binding CsgD family transcriptional regulator/tetratricopeptide (TPR) repeat protein
MLLGREAEQQRLDLLLRRAEAGQSGVLVLRGEPGIGKTALLDHAASQAGSMRVLRASGIESEADIAFAGLYSLLHPVAEFLDVLPHRQAAAVRSALGLTGGPGSSSPDRLAVAVGTHGLLTSAAEARPVLVLVDDAHWLDPATTEALLFAIRRLGSDAVGCVLSARPDGRALDDLPVLDLAGLRQSDAALLVEAVAGIAPAPAVTRRLHAETGGNPLALTELAAALSAQQLAGAGLPEAPEVPLEPGAGVRQRYAARLAALDPSVRATLLVAAAAGRCPAAVVMSAAGQLGGGEALAEAEDGRLVRLSAGGVEFCHPLVRSVAYHAAQPSQRRAAHRALAEALGGRDPERAAWHLAAAATGADDAAAAALDDAARLAEQKGATLVAAATWERASELSLPGESQAWRLLRAAEAALRAGDLDRAGRLAATPTARLRGQQQVRLLAVRGRVDMLRGRMATAQGLFRDAGEFAADDDPGLATELLARAVAAALEAGLEDEAGRSAELMAQAAARSDETARFLADLASGALASYRGEPAEGMRLQRRAAARLDADPGLASSAERQLDVADAFAGIGRPDRARRYADRAIELAHDEGALGRLPDALSAAAWCRAETGSWPRALALGAQALELAQAAGQAYLACDALITMTSIEAAQGRDRECREHVRDAERLSAELGLPLMRLLVRRHLALLEFGCGRLEKAISLYEQVRRLAAELGVHEPYFSPLPELVEAYTRAGDPGRAQTRMAEYLADAPADGNPLARGRADRCRGIVAETDFDSHFQQAIALHGNGMLVFQQARSQLCYGERLRRARRRRDARTQLRAAAEAFDRLDARPWADRARAELRATGETVTEPGRVPERLTPQELQIALLVAEGRTNAEVGKAVFLSTRTVEFHLSRAYRKLGVATRTELARQLLTAAAPS